MCGWSGKDRGSIDRRRGRRATKQIEVGKKLARVCRRRKPKALDDRFPFLEC
jgi:hypothetical protein